MLATRFIFTLNRIAYPRNGNGLLNVALPLIFGISVYKQVKRVRGKQ
jgi:hypothetical protein